MKNKQSAYILIPLVCILSMLLPACGSQKTPPPTEAVTQVIPATEAVAQATPATDDVTQAPAEEITDLKGVTMRRVPAGPFIMGDPADTALAECQKLYIGLSIEGTCDRAFFTDEEPSHTVQLDSFYMDKVEVSNSAYRQCVNSGGCQPPTDTSSATHLSYYGNSEYDNYPVIYVDWNMAKTYCEWRGARLPTEAEWEKAARGVDERLYPWGSDFDGTPANFCDSNCSLEWSNKNYNDGYAETAPVDAYSSGVSAYGIFNMAGNVWEWVADWYDPGAYASSPSADPQGASSGEYRVVRGGSWTSYGSSLRSANRDWDSPTYSYYDYGFRCALSP